MLCFIDETTSKKKEDLVMFNGPPGTEYKQTEDESSESSVDGPPIPAADNNLVKRSEKNNLGHDKSIKETLITGKTITCEFPPGEACVTGHTITNEFPPGEACVTGHTITNEFPPSGNERHTSDHTQQ